MKKIIIIAGLVAAFSGAYAAQPYSTRVDFENLSDYTMHLDSISIISGSKDAITYDHALCSNLLHGATCSIVAVSSNNIIGKLANTEYYVEFQLTVDKPNSVCVINKTYNVSPEYKSQGEYVNINMQYLGEKNPSVQWVSMSTNSTCSPK